MSKRIKVDELPAFDAAPYLDSDETMASYLSDILQANDAGLLCAALGDSARARGMTEIAKAAGITREALYKALRPGSAPRFDTVNRVCAALGVRLVVPPLQSGWLVLLPCARQPIRSRHRDLASFHLQQPGLLQLVQDAREMLWSQVQQ